MYKQIELYDLREDILSKTTESYCEMTKPEHGFLCGLIKKFQPEKVVEVGVAGGGTTTVVMKCLETVSPDAKMYSVDISKECYRRKGRESGFQLEEVKEYLTNYKNHQFYLGKVLPKVIEEIGGGIDFAILDTVHALPGEVLDFLCLLPYLKKDAIVVLHDVTLNLSRSEKAFATKILFDTVHADKYYDYKHQILNIAAFQITEDTLPAIANVFSSLSVSWAYLPNLSDIMAYRDKYREFYEQECIDLFDIFLDAQYARFHRQEA